MMYDARVLDLNARLRQANDDLISMARDKEKEADGALPDSVARDRRLDARRLRAKAEGVRLAMSYADEMLR